MSGPRRKQVLKSNIEKNVPELVVRLTVKIIARKIQRKSAIEVQYLMHQLLAIQQRNLTGDFFRRMSGHVEIPVRTKVILSGSDSLIGSNAARDLGFCIRKAIFHCRNLRFQ